jgi:hypothetical protein
VPDLQRSPTLPHKSSILLSNGLEDLLRPRIDTLGMGQSRRNALSHGRRNLSQSCVGQKIEPYEGGGAVGTYRVLFGLSLAVLCCYLSAGMNDSNDGTHLTLPLLKEERT